VTDRLEENAPPSRLRGWGARLRRPGGRAGTGRLRARCFVTWRPFTYMHEVSASSVRAWVLVEHGYERRQVLRYEQVASVPGQFSCHNPTRTVRVLYPPTALQSSTTIPSSNVRMSTLPFRGPCERKCAGSAARPRVTPGDGAGQPLPAISRNTSSLG
jgi:hypothetical protein